MGFSRQEYWSGPPGPPTGDLPDPGTEAASLTSPALAGGFFITSTTWKATLETLCTTMNGPRRTPFTALESKRLQLS